MTGTPQRTCILVLGMHRSGTSALTRVINLLGAALPKNILGAGPGNEMGHWEPERLVHLHDAMLAEAGSSWDDWRRSDLAVLAQDRLAQYRADFRRTVDEEYGDAPLFVLKEPRICRFVPLYRAIFAEMGVAVRPILMIRHPAAVAGSLGARNDLSLDSGQLLWARHVLDAERATRDLPRAIVQFDDLLSDWAAALDGVGRCLGVVWPRAIADASSDVADFLSPSHDHHGAAATSGAADLGLAQWVRQLHDAVRTLNKPSDTVFLDRVAAACDAAAARIGTRLVGDPESDTAGSGDRDARLAEASALRDREAVSSVLHHLTLAERDAARAEAEQRLSDLMAERAAVAQYAEQLAAAVDARDTLIGERDALAVQFADVRCEFSDARRANAALRSDIAALRRELDAISAEKASEQSRAAQLERQVHEAWRAVEQLHTMYRTSTSWRLTAPLRVMSKISQQVLKMPSRKPRLSGITSAVFHLPNQATHAFVNDTAMNRKDALFAPWHRSYVRLVRSIPASADIPPVTVSVVLLNAERWLPRFLATFEAQAFPKEKLSVHFIDHGSHDATVSLVESFAARVSRHYRAVQLTHARNAGYGAGNDHVIRATSDEFVLVTNVDVEFHEGSLARAAAFAASDTPDVACWEFRQCPLEHPKYYDPVTLDTAWSSHACVLLRRSAYIEVGGYEKRIFMYGEDAELSYRFRARGYRLRYLPACTLTHHVTTAEPRPLQLSGSLSSNVLLRYRYGAPTEGIAGEIALRTLALTEQDAARNTAIAEALKTVALNRKHFKRLSNVKSRVAFPFMGFDYHLRKDGHDVPLTPVEQVKAPKVTVITRTHGPKVGFLSEAMASVLNQTYTNIEHLIVEDRTDHAAELVEQVQAAYPVNVKYMKSDGTGRSRAGNVGLAAATGDYVMFLDNDDLLFADHIELLVSRLERHREFVAAYAIGWETRTECSGNAYYEVLHEVTALHREPFSQDRLLVMNFIPIQCNLFRRHLYELFGGFDEELDYLEDWNLWVRYARGGDFLCVPKLTSLYRTPASEFDRARRQKKLDDAYSAVLIKNGAAAHLPRHFVALSADEGIR